jgi:uncharacterized membrane protein YqjE
MDIQPLAVAGVVVAILVFIRPFNDLAMLAGAVLLLVVGGILGTFTQ